MNRIIKLDLWANADCKICKGGGIITRRFERKGMKIKLHPRLCTCIKPFKEAAAPPEDAWQQWCSGV